ncbi:nitrogenase component 1 [Dehalobacterium formicoaceticum]|uniref:nitrogenase component 1 n=1 Tax=Dehalobacterium formicoaceticum TaxID=51515 RepID=UPI000B7D2040|nr:nitrogenase component 1 [Dehalobacterium formicoaceticum]
MKYYSKNITPDSLSGIVFALEGINKSVVIINGPTGCKYYHSAISDSRFPRQTSFDPLNYPDKFYFKQPRVPCTYLDSYDYVYGSGEKLNDLLDYIDKQDQDLVAIVNSPGAALIGDDLAGIAAKKIHHSHVITIENPGYSQNFYRGFQDALIVLLKSLPLETAPGKKQGNLVNLIGISIYNKYFLGDIQEMERLFNACGLQINCVLCADTSLEEIKKIPQADLNVILYPELGLEVAKYLQEALGMPYFLFDRGLPIGFDLTQSYFEGVLREESLAGGASFTSRSLISALEKARADAYIPISNVYALTGLPKGTTFAVEAPSSALLAYTDFLFQYLGMVPTSLNLPEDDPGLYEEQVQDLLKEHHLESAWQRDIFAAKSDIVLSNGSTIAQLKLQEQIFSGIEIELPSLGYLDVIPKTHLGIQGSLLLVEQLLNGLNF